MSDFDDRSVAGAGHDKGLWQEPSQALAPAPTSVLVRSGADPHPSEMFVTHDADSWSSRLDGALSSGLSNDAARIACRDANLVQHQAAFEAWRTQCAVEVVPVLERSAQMLRDWGLDAHVRETLQDRPARLPRRHDVTLRIERFGERGPGRLTISAAESSEVVRVTLKLGPYAIGGEANEHVGMTTSRDLSGELVGGLVATLVEQLFS